MVLQKTSKNWIFFYKAKYLSRYLYMWEKEYLLEEKASDNTQCLNVANKSSELRFEVTNPLGESI